jgi:predicted phosphodiesterase
VKTIFVMPDVHAPGHDKRAVACAIEAIHASGAAEVLILGDFIDALGPARWSRGLAEEFVANLDFEVHEAKKILADIRSVFAGPISFLLGNHEDRIDNYVRKHAPALASIVPTVAEMLDFERYRVEQRSQPYAVAPGVRAIHGKKLTSTQQAARQSAYKERMRFGHSIVQGHTHRLGIGWDRQERSRFWLEAGCLLDFRKAGYLDFEGQANWMQGFALLHVDGQNVWPEVVPIHRGKAVLHGRRLSA